MKNLARRDQLTHSKANGKQFKYSQNFIGRQYKNKGLLSDVIVQTIEKNTGTSLLQLKDESVDLCVLDFSLCLFFNICTMIAEDFGDSRGDFGD